MIQNIKDLWRKLQFLLVISLGLLPLALLFFALFLPEQLPLVWVYTGAYVLLAAIGMVVPGKRRKLYTIIACCVMAVMGVVALYITMEGYLIPITAIFTFLLFVSMGMASWTWQDELPNIYYWAGISIHVVVQLILLYIAELDAPAPGMIGTATQVVFFIFMPLALLSMGRGNMVDAGMRRHRAAGAVRAKNGFMILAFFGIGALIAFSPVVEEVVGKLVAWISELIEAYMMSQIPETAPSESEEGTTLPIIGEDIPIQPPTEFAKWLEKVLLGIFDVLYAIAVPLLVIAGVLIVAWLLYQLMRKVYASLLRRLSNVTEDYVDEVTDTRADREKTSLTQKLKGKLTFVNERALPPAERIRYRYKMLLKKHPEWVRSSTARENLPDEMAPYYEKARYTKKDLTKEDAENFTSGVKNV